MSPTIPLLICYFNYYNPVLKKYRIQKNIYMYIGNSLLILKFFSIKEF
jgi:hypothetical protein